MDRAVGQAYQAILGVGDLTVAQAKQLFIPMREGGFGLASAEPQAEPAMMASWASCAARVTARVGLGGIDDLTAEIPGLRSALSKLQAIKREAGEDPNDLTRPGSTATSQRALALSRVNNATTDLRDHIGANCRHRVALDSASGPPPDSSNSRPPTLRSCTSPLSSMRPECGYADPCVTPVIGAKNKKADGTECGAALDKEGKHATTCPCGHALSARHNALRDEIANTARRTGLCADIEVLADHPAIDPPKRRENGRENLQNRCPERRRAHRRSSYLPVLRGGSWSCGQSCLHRREQEANKIQTCGRHTGHPRDPRPNWPHPQGVPDQDRPRGSASPGHLVAKRHEAHFMCPPDPQRAHLRQMQRIHLPPCLPGSSRPFAPCSWPPCSGLVSSRLGDPLRLIWPPGVVFLVPGRLFWV